MARSSVRWWLAGVVVLIALGVGIFWWMRTGSVRETGEPAPQDGFVTVHISALPKPDLKEMMLGLVDTSTGLTGMPFGNSWNFHHEFGVPTTDRFQFVDSKSATAGEGAMRTILEQSQTAKTFRDTKLERSGAEVHLSVSLNPAERWTWWLPGGSMWFRFRAKTRESRANLQAIGQGLRKLADTSGETPVNILSQDGKPLLSWRVAMLPALGQEELFRKFKLGEPWDSAHNKTLLTPVPSPFLSSGRDANEGLTHYQTFVDIQKPFDRAPFRPDGKAKVDSFSNITDGTSNVIFCIEATDGVPWTKPADLPIDLRAPLPRIGGLFTPNTADAVMYDGHDVRFHLNWMKPDAFKASVTHAGGEVSEWGW